MKTYSYNIIDAVYDWMISRKKDIEVRIQKEKSEAIQIGDVVVFYNQEKKDKYIKTRIINKTMIENVDELLKLFDVSRIMPGHTKEELINLLNKIYGDELKTKKIIAFEFEYLNCESDIEIIEYDERYLEDVKDLLVELEEYIVSIDKDNLDQVHPEYREKMTTLDLEEVNSYEGKCYLALQSNNVVGLIMGIIPPYDEFDYLDYKCPKCGEITELIVKNKIRSKGIGEQLIKKMEQYFKSLDCEYVKVDVFAYNEIAKNFYTKNKYHSRLEIRIKKID